MLQTVKDCCELQPNALEYAMGDQIEHLSDLLKQTETDAETFFAKNYVTAGMAILLREGLRRLSGKSDQAVFELKQAMGGGKTHSMLALGVIARNPSLRDKVPADITAGLTLPTAKVVAINGRSVSPDIFLWGDIADQIGKKDAFAGFWKDGAQAPTEKDWIKLIGDEPTLILLDELPPYFDYAITRPVGGGTLANVTTYALSNLLAAALKLPRLCVVLSNLSGSYQGASKDLGKAIRDFQQEANRQARSITPVELSSNEIYEILKKRLFSKTADASVVDAVASAYGDAMGEAIKSKTVAKSAEQIADEIVASYPFHPSVKHVIALFKENESYRQTRGLMQFASKMLKSVWQRPTNDVYLIGCQYLDLNIGDVREEFNRISNLQGATATDVASSGEAHAEVIDASVGNDAASQVARLLLTASLSESVDAVKGLTKQQAIECLVAPHRSPLEFDNAFEDLRKESWYLHRRENDTWYFSNVENLRKRIDNRAANAPQPKIDAEMKRRLEVVFSPTKKIAYQTVIALPKLSEIKLSGPRMLLVVSPDSKTPPEDAKKLFDDVTEKNNFCVVTGDGSSLGNLEETVRRIWAVAKVREEVGGNPQLIPELDEEAETAEFDFNSTLVSLFNRVYYPARVSGQDTLTYAKLQLAVRKEDNTSIVDGEGAIQEALTGIGAKKVVLDVKVEADPLMQRAEDMLWPGTEKRIPWKDLTSRAISNPRWLWLPPKGLDEIRTIAQGQDRWRYTDDGYIEKGPFAPPKTSVRVQERDYNDETGKATIEVSAVEAGPNARIHFASSPDVSASSPTIPDTIFETGETALWFLAIDPDGKHETGEPVRWSNRLTITHQPQIILGKRVVTLTVRPKGQIRWNTTGANPKEGKIYKEPIEIEGNAEVTIYAYAEDNGVSAVRNFKIPAPDDTGVSIDKDKKATLRKPLVFDGNAKVFAALKLAKDAKGVLGTIQIEVGKGAKNATTRFGSESIISAEDVERFITLAREAIGESAADVKISFKEISFASGHDLETFVAGIGIDVGMGEVEQ